MNILLVNLKFPDTFWSFKHALEFVGKRSALPPLGLLTVAAMLPPDWSLRLVDTNVRGLTDKDLAWADCAFISAMVVQRESARRIVARCKEAGLRVVAGGPLFSSEHEQFENVDHFILNEAELTLPPFLEDLAQGRPRRLYASAEFANLRQTPMPRWDLLSLKRYASMGIQFTRGCPFNCYFCNVTALLGHCVRMKTSAQIIAELDGLYALGWRGDVFFVDDNFIGNKQFLKTDLLPALIAWRKQKAGNVFFTEASINLADDKPFTKLYERMKQKGRLRAESSGDNVDGTTNIIPTMSIESLKEGYRRILDHIYSPAPYYQRVRTFLREYRGPHVRGTFKFSHLLALVRSVYRIGFVGRERRHYRKLLLWTQFRRPRLIPDAVIFAIYGYHFRKICERHVV